MEAQSAAIDIANSISVQKLVREYLKPPFETFVENGVTICTVQTWNRFGVPPRSETWLYEFSGNGWEMVVRAVFHAGDLLEPPATYCVIISCRGSNPDTHAPRLMNQWLRSLDL